LSHFVECQTAKPYKANSGRLLPRIFNNPPDITNILPTIIIYPPGIANVLPNIVIYLSDFLIITDCCVNFCLEPPHPASSPCALTLFGHISTLHSLFPHFSSLYVL